jgi:hypothetical protein
MPSKKSETVVVKASEIRWDILYRPKYPITFSNVMEDSVEKYGVDTGANPGEKIANATSKCPRCGMELDKDAPVPKCPVHGTLPFERRPGEEEG